MAEIHQDVQRSIEQLGPWFHNLHLPDGTQTAPEHYLGDFPSRAWLTISPHLPADLRGWSVLDIGCNAGFYCFELADRGASVLGIDHDEHYLRQARWAAGQFGLEDAVRFERRQVYDLVDRGEQFDLVLFMGVFYHLRYPLLGLDIVAQCVRKLMVFQTLQMPGPAATGPTPEDIPIHARQPLTDEHWPRMAFIEHRLQNDPTNWWAPNPAACEAMLRSTGLSVVNRPAPETYLCEAPADGVGNHRHWDTAELRAATHAGATRGAQEQRDGA
ncbi:MAG: TIGR04290 family methyltransferase [Phycisphaeraceae bacterium]